MLPVISSHSSLRKRFLKLRDASSILLRHRDVYAALVRDGGRWVYAPIAKFPTRVVGEKSLAKLADYYQKPVRRLRAEEVLD